ncbi:hypothetical protein ACFLX7_04565 [Chloroflexota bacterium]
MKWYGETMDDLKIKMPKTLPPYIEDSEIEKLFNAIENKRSHKDSIVRDSILVSLALKTRMRRSELSNMIRTSVIPCITYLVHKTTIVGAIVATDMAAPKRINYPFR